MRDGVRGTTGRGENCLRNRDTPERGIADEETRTSWPPYVRIKNRRTKANKFKRDRRRNEAFANAGSKRNEALIRRACRASLRRSDRAGI